MSDTIELTKELISRASITPADAGCQQLMMNRLKAIGFNCRPLPFGEVENFWAQRGETKPLFVFAGHTDVVPTGPLERWLCDPFQPEEHDGYLYGRGAADMKSSLAAMVTACERFITQHPQHHGSIGFLVTSDEEGPAVDGTVKVIDALSMQGINIDACLVGEPSSREKLGDMIKNGRRGSLHGILTIQGVQGHVAYPEQVRNPIHMSGAIVAALANEFWDSGNKFFPPTSFQVSNISAGTGATNVVPGELECVFNFRFSTESSQESLQQRTEQLIVELIDKEQHLSGRLFTAEVKWNLSGLPFLTEPGDLLDSTAKAVKAELSIEPEISTSGGTSDGRFIAPTGAQVVELGPVNATIHQINECVAIADIDRLSAVYQRVLENYLGVN